MTIRTRVTIASIAASAALAVVLAARAGGDKIAFPENYAKGVLYTTLDRADNKQYRELYTSAAAVDAAKAKVFAHFFPEGAGNPAYDELRVAAVFKKLEAEIVRLNILDTGRRIRVVADCASLDIRSVEVTGQ